MRELSPERERAAELTLQAIPDALQAKTSCGVYLTSDVKLQELAKTAELQISEPGNYKYCIKDTSIIKSEHIKQPQSDSLLMTHIQIIEGDLYQVCRMYNNATIICDVNAIVPGGGFRVGDDSNEAQLCRYSTLYHELNTKIAKMRYYYSNTPMGRWAQDAIIVVPEVLFFSDLFTETITRHVVLGFSPPNMSVTSARLKLSAQTNECFTKRVNDAFNLALDLTEESISNKTLIIPIFGYKTFSLPVRLCAAVLADTLNRIVHANVDRIVLVVDDENKVLLDDILSLLTDIIDEP